MLFIYSELDIGGIQTFFVRMAKSRHNHNQKTKILLTQPEAASNQQLLIEARKYAEVYFLQDISALPSAILKYMPQSLLLLVPLNKHKVLELLKDVREVHVATSICGFLHLRMAQLIHSIARITFGVYHAKEYIWDINGYTPFYQKANKEIFCSSFKNQVYFNPGVMKTYESSLRSDLSRGNLFPIGVIDPTPSQLIPVNKRKNGKFTIGSIGRLVSFKSYNLWMLDILKELTHRGYDARYIIYGDGPLRDCILKKIDDLKIHERVELRGNISYEKLPVALGEFDLFIGSGTSIVEASARGIPSIIGIESNEEPSTYGFFSDIPGFTYNEDGEFPKVPALELIEDLINLGEDELQSLGNRHCAKSKMFDMDTCLDNFSHLDPHPFSSEDVKRYTTFHFRLKYSLTHFLIPRLIKLLGKDPSKIIYG